MNNGKRNFYSPALSICRGAIIASLYVALTSVASALGLASGVVQFRISEMLCILPIFFVEAIPALFIGCLISNLVSGGVILDVIFGSIATLIGAYGAFLLKKLPNKLMFLTTLPTILANAIIVPFVLLFAYKLEGGYFYFASTVGLGELICAGVGGSILYYSLYKINFQKIKAIKK